MVKRTLVARSGERANFLAGGEVPFPEAQCFGATSIDHGDIVADFLRKGVLPSAALPREDFEVAADVRRTGGTIITN